MNKDQMGGFNLPLLQTVFVYGIHYLYLLGLYMLLYAWFGGIMPVMGGFFYLTGLYVLCIFKKRYLQNIFLSIASALVLITADTFFCSIFSGLSSAVFFCSFVILIFFLVIDIRDWKFGQERRIYSVLWYYIAEPIMLYIYGFYKQQNSFQFFALFLIVAWLITHFSCGYLNGVERYFEINKRIDGMPRSMIFKKNSRQLVIIMSVMLLLLVFSVFFQFDEIFIYLGRFLVKIAGILFLLFSYLILLLEMLHLLPKGSAEQFRNADFLSMLSGMSRWWFFVFKLLSDLLLCVLAFFFIRNVIRFFWERGEEVQRRQGKFIPENVADAVERITPVRKGRYFQIRNNNDRVRWLFYTRVKRQYKNGVPETKTARELLTPDDEKLASLYNIARYSEHTVSNEEIREYRADSP